MQRDRTLNENETPRSPTTQHYISVASFSLSHKDANQLQEESEVKERKRAERSPYPVAQTISFPPGMLAQHLRATSRVTQNDDMMDMDFELPLMREVVISCSDVDKYYHRRKCSKNSTQVQQKSNISLPVSASHLDFTVVHPRQKHVAPGLATISNSRSIDLDTKAIARDYTIMVPSRSTLFPEVSGRPAIPPKAFNAVLPSDHASRWG